VRGLVDRLKQAPVEGSLVLLFHDQIGIWLTAIFRRSSLARLEIETMIELVAVDRTQSKRLLHYDAE
jgi:hypothetical protein